MKKNDSENEFISLLGRFFTEYLQVSVNASPNTIASYKCAFRLLFQYLNEETDEIQIHNSTSSHQNRLVSEYFLDTPLAMNRSTTLTAELKRPTAVE